MYAISGENYYIWKKCSIIYTDVVTHIVLYVKYLPPCPYQSRLVCLIFKIRNSSISLVLCLEKCEFLPKHKNYRSRNKFCRHKTTFNIKKHLWNEIYPEQNPVICNSSERTQRASLWRSSLNLTFKFKAGKHEQPNLKKTKPKTW